MTAFNDHTIDIVLCGGCGRCGGGAGVDVRRSRRAASSLFITCTMEEPITTSSAHTPGPWSIGNDLDVPCGYDFIPIGAHDNAVAWVEARTDEIDRGRGQANARLITAAPELLDALDYLVGCHELQPDAELEEDTELAIACALEVLAKAGSD